MSAEVEGETNEQLRRRYLPGQVRLLFVGESPPASGRFFYKRDSGLYRAMREVFEAVEPAVNDETFLQIFQASGCYLIDLCPQPVDRMTRVLRRAACRASEESLARTIALLRPRMIVTTLRSIDDHVSRAAAQARWSGRSLQLPYPGRWAHLKREFVTGLMPVIAAIMKETV
jgi:hypothetical protein